MTKYWCCYTRVGCVRFSQKDCALNPREQKRGEFALFHSSYWSVFSAQRAPQTCITAAWCFIYISFLIQALEKLFILLFALVAFMPRAKREHSGAGWMAFRIQSRELRERRCTENPPFALCTMKHATNYKRLHSTSNKSITHCQRA